MPDEDVEQGIRDCLPIEGDYEGGLGYIETDRMGIDAIVATLKTFIQERDQRVAPTRLPEPEYGSTNITVEGMQYTLACGDCGAILLQLYAPPGMGLPQLAHPYVMCCKKLRRIG